jgi:muramoyltetrapeptide carboxypeptidase
MKAIKPKKLRAGDTVGIISPSEPIEFRNEFYAGVRELEGIGLRVLLGKNVFRKYGGYMAGTVEQRLHDLHSMFRNPKVKAIFVSGGGFCVNQILPFVNYSLIKNNPKILMGYSDITVLLNAIYAKTGLITFHGPSVELSIANWEKFTKNGFIKATFQSKPLGKITGLSSWKVFKRGKATGRLLGGNLTVLRTLIGTKYNPDWKNAILFWEDCDLTYEDLDHFITHLKLTGIFDKISGMVIGANKNFKKVTIGEESDSEKKNFFSPKKIILERTKEYHFPIISGVEFGHRRDQMTIPIGVQATIDASKRLFSIDESGVS